MLYKELLEWLDKFSKIKPKYTHLIMLENTNYIYTKLMEISQNYQKSEYLDTVMIQFKKIYEEHLTKYIHEILTYNYPYLKEEGQE